MTLEILAVDNSRTMRDLIKLALIPEGFVVHTAEDGVEGVKLLHNITPNAIITDINLPHIDGFGFINAVREQDAHRATPILVLTTECEPHLKKRAKEAGATGWIVKPFDPIKLVKALRMIAG